MNEIRNFLARFHVSDSIDEVFTCGCCYWFALILCIRFNGVIMYDPVMNHFGTEINGHIYDITGCIDGKYNMQQWKYFSDNLERERIIRDCIMF